MSSTQNSTIYFLSGGIESSTTGGTQINCGFEMTISAGTDFTDADAFALQQALIAAFPASWEVDNESIPVSKTDDTLVSYTTNYTATPPSFT